MASIKPSALVMDFVVNVMAWKMIFASGRERMSKRMREKAKFAQRQKRQNEKKMSTE